MTDACIPLDGGQALDVAMIKRFLTFITFVTMASIGLAAGGRHADPELEALLPKTLGGRTLVIESQAGSELSTDSAPFDAFLASLGKSRTDFRLASAYSLGDLKAAVSSWRVIGADSSALLPGFRQTMQAASSTPLTTLEEVVAGRKVTRIGDPGQLAQGPLYVFVKGDTLFFVQTSDPQLAAEAIGKLPPL